MQLDNFGAARRWRRETEKYLLLLGRELDNFHLLQILHATLHERSFLYVATKSIDEVLLPLDLSLLILNFLPQRFEIGWPVARRLIEMTGELRPVTGFVAGAGTGGTIAADPAESLKPSRPAPGTSMAGFPPLASDANPAAQIGATLDNSETKPGKAPTEKRP